MEQKFGISLNREYGAMPITDAIELIKAAGFSAVSPTWGSKIDMDAVCQKAKAVGLFIQSIHSPFGSTDKLWSPDPEVCSKALGFVMRALDDCIRNQVSIMVMHAWIDNGLSYDMEDLYFGNFDAIVAKAAANGVQIAFENTEGEEYLFALLEHYKGNPHVGFCWDSGHEKCYNHDMDLLARFGDRLLMTHLNDNLGISDPGGEITYLDDLHLLPFDGCIDWQRNARRLSGCQALPYWNCELLLVSKPGRNENDKYGQMPLADYFKLAYERAERIFYEYPVCW